MDNSAAEVEKALAPHLAQFGQRHDNKAKENILEMLESDRFVERNNL